MDSKISTTNSEALYASLYDQEYYDKHIPGAVRSARAEVVPIVMDAIRPRSVLDVGCGTCVWLREFLRCGATDVLGVDGEYVDQNSLAIPKQFFRAQDLDDGRLELGRFDLSPLASKSPNIYPEALPLLLSSRLLTRRSLCYSRQRSRGKVGFTTLTSSGPATGRRFSQATDTSRFI